MVKTMVGFRVSAGTLIVDYTARESSRWEYAFRSSRLRIRKLLTREFEMAVETARAYTHRILSPKRMLLIVLFGPPKRPISGDFPINLRSPNPSRTCSTRAGLASKVSPPTTVRKWALGSYDGERYGRGTYQQGRGRRVKRKPSFVAPRRNGLARSTTDSESLGPGSNPSPVATKMVHLRVLSGQTLPRLSDPAKRLTKTRTLGASVVGR